MSSQTGTVAESAVGGTVAFDIEDGVAVLTIDNPPVNAGSHAVRSGLVNGLRRAAEEGATAAVLMGAGRSFISGSDLREFGAKLAPPELPDVIAAVEAAPFPVLAALHGVALGGGLELALGCDWRIAAPGTKLGLPEVSLGILPGAGGTQRLPRLVGQARAIAMICDASRVPAEQALADGMIDALAEGDLRQAALEFLATPRAKRRVRDMTVPSETAERIEKAATRATRRGAGRPNVVAAIDLVRRSAEPDIDAVLADERAEFQQLRLAADAFALRYLFFAERKAATVPGLDTSLARQIAHVGVVGGGTMGQGIVRALLGAGLQVSLMERDQETLDTALARLDRELGTAVEKGFLTEEAFARQKQALSGTTTAAGLAHCDLVIEAVFEDMDVKRKVLADLEAALPADALIATNTSYLDIDAMVQGLARPGNVLGLHFFSPADRMKLLEIVRAGATSDAALASGLKLARKLGKQPVVARVAEGFIGNRIYNAYRRRAELLVLDGATPQQVDEVVTGFGFAMGPFAVSDMSGLDIAWAMRKRLAATRDPAARYVEIPDMLCEAGRFGRKTGKGWYDYASGKAVPDPETDAIIAAARDRAGIAPRAYDAETIQRQLMAAIVNEAACLLAEGVAMRPSDVDVALANGYGFARWRGGPLYWAAQQPSDVLAQDLDQLAQAVGPDFRPGPVADTLTQLDDAKG